MKTECKSNQLKLHPLHSRDVIAKFDGGNITSDCGAFLLREVEKRTHILKRFSNCFTDYRNPKLIEHTVEALITQRIFGIAMGYEDLNDHDTLRQDPFLGMLCEKKDPTGSDRRMKRDKGKASAGTSTLNRLELGAVTINRYKKIAPHMEAIDDLLVDLFIESYARAPEEIIFDLDATDDPIHGNQAGRFFHGYYGHYCYLPLYIFCGEQLLCARLRTADRDASDGVLTELERILKKVRAAWSKTRILIRGDSGFCRNEIMDWCEANGVDYVLGLAKNKRLQTEIIKEMAEAKIRHEATGLAARVFKDFRYQTLKSWSRERRVVGKAEYLNGGENPRFIVTSFGSEYPGVDLYETCYCARGEMENRIKEQQLYLFADRTSTHGMASNQLRLYFSSFAYVIMETLRRLALCKTEMAKAQCSTIRLKLFKIGAQIRVSVRKVWLSISESYPFADLLNQVLKRLQQIPLRI
jgi:Transposase DDE domain group 1